MTPGACPLTLYRGDDWAMKVTVQDTNEAVVDLTGWTASAQIRKRPNDTTALLDINTLIDEVNNLVVLRINHTEAATLSNNGFWDLQLIDPTGIVQTVLAGPVTVTLDVTRP